MWFLLLILHSLVPPIKEAPQIPVLCYHNFSATGSGDVFRIDARSFREQMQTLRDSGFRTPEPYEALTGKVQVAKPVIITFDDSHADHFLKAAPILEEMGFRGLFFIMTVTIGKQGYLSARQIKSLHDRGHWIGSHTWDHPRVSGIQGIPDPERQLTQSRQALEKITNAQVILFAYPYGSWNDTFVRQVKEAGYLAAFQLGIKKMSSSPAFTIRRVLVNGSWNGKQLIHMMVQSFR